MQRQGRIGTSIGCRHMLAAAGLALLVGIATSTALATGPIGMNYVNYGTTSSTPQDANAVAIPTTNTEPCGAPGFRQVRWNNFGYRSAAPPGVGPQLYDDSNTLIPGVFASWYGSSRTSNAVTLQGSDQMSKRMMSYYLDSGGLANTSDTGAFTYNTSANGPNAYVEGLSAWMAENGAASYTVVLYTEGGNAIGRVGAFWLQEVTAFDATSHYATELGAHLTPTIYVIDNWQYGNYLDDYAFIKVPDTATSEAQAAPGNYIVFRGLTADKLEIRTEEISTPPPDTAKRVWLCGWQILPEKTPYANLPTVSITKDTDAAEPSTNGQFTVTRSGDTTNPLVVQYAIAGTAIRGMDFTLANSVTIPAGASSAPITVVPLADTVFEPTPETITLTIPDGVDFKAGAQSSATMLLSDPPISPSWTFYYYDNFNEGYDEYWDRNQQYNSGYGYVPAGWRTYTDEFYWITGTNNREKPRLYSGSEWTWQTSPFGNSAQGAQNYGAPWSGSGNPTDTNHNLRFNLNNPWVSWQGGGRNNAAFFLGDTPAVAGTTARPVPYYVAPPGIGFYPRHWTGNYPMDLRANSLQAAFDLSIRTGTGTCGQYSDGTYKASTSVYFVIQPPSNIDLDTYPSDSGGYGTPNSLPGIVIGFDIHGDPGDPGFTDWGNYTFDAHNHVSFDVQLKSSPDDVANPSVATNLDPPYAASIVDMKKVGDNNQPLHVTVFYNDPEHGGAGIVRVYMYVDPAQAPAQPYTTAGLAPLYDPASLSFGMLAPGQPKNNGLGELVLEACAGPWQSDRAIFGFVARSEWVGNTDPANHDRGDSVLQVDNVNVLTKAAEPATACAATWAPTFDPGTSVALQGAPVASSPSGLSEPGWRVTNYMVHATGSATSAPYPMEVFKQSIAYDLSMGFPGGKTVTGEPSVNYFDIRNGSDKFVPAGRQFPGTQYRANNDYVGLACLGYIYFPAAGDYSLCVVSDNSFELKIGGSTVMTTDGDPDPNYYSGNWGQGVADTPHVGYFRNVQVAAAGVYPIQLLWEESTGGASVEFFRRTNDPLEPFVLIGESNAGRADQPVVYGLLGGNAPALDLDEATPYPYWTINLDSSQRVGDLSVVGPTRGFNYKAVRAYYHGMGIQNAWTEDYMQVGLGFLDALDPITANRVVSTLNFQTAEGDDTYPMLPYSAIFTDIPSGTGNFAVRGEGFATFPDQGLYILGVYANDDGYVRIGSQTIEHAWQSGWYNLAIWVDQPGVYPIRVEMVGAGTANYLKFFELAPGVGYVPVNDENARVKVYTTSTAMGPFVYPNRAYQIPADRMVAAVGQGGSLGWNAVAVKAPAGISLDNNMGLATGLIEGDVVGLAGGFERGTATMLAINLKDIGDEEQGEFVASSTDTTLPANQLTADDTTAVFLKTDATPLFTAAGNKEFAVSWQGYMEFPVAGDYIFNTNCSDGMIMWIAGTVTAEGPFNSWPGDNGPCFVHVEQPGIYDVRVDFFKRTGGNGPTCAEICQYLPEKPATTTTLMVRALVNDPKLSTSTRRVKVYSALAAGVTPLTTAYANPVRISASARAGAMNYGGDSGVRVQVVNGDFLYGDGNSGMGSDKLRSWQDFHELLAKVLDGEPSLNQYGTLVGDAIKPMLNLTGTADFPGPPHEDWFATRVTGYIGLKAGGHVFQMHSDDGYIMTIDGKTLIDSGPLWDKTMTFYIWVEQDGLYPFTAEHNELWGGNVIVLTELVYDGATATPVLVNDPADLRSARLYANVAPCGEPYVDATGDHDVDMEDFAAFQACYTGSMGGAPLAWPCKCFDRDGAGGTPDGIIDAMDLLAFTRCFTGPSVTWTATVDCPQ